MHWYKQWAVASCHIILDEAALGMVDVRKRHGRDAHDEELRALLLQQVLEI